MFRKLAQSIGIFLFLAGMFTLPVQAASIHTISGTITLNAVGLKGVVVTIQGTTFTATTNGKGDYAIHNVPSATTGSIVPTLANYSFSPKNIAFSNLQANLTAQNFTATQISAITYSISGQTLNGSTGVSGVTVTFGTLTTTSGANGAYSFSNVAAGTRGRIVAKMTGFTFTPSFISVSGLKSNLTGQNFSAAATYTISGKVTETGTGLPLGGVTVTLGTLSAVTNSTTGAYTIRNIPAGTSGTLTPSLAGKTFTPTTIAVTSLAASLHSENFVAAP